MAKKVLAVILGVIVVFSIPSKALEDYSGNMIDEDEVLDLRDLEKQWGNLEDEFGEYIPQLDLRKIVSGEESGFFSVSDFLRNIVAFLFKEVVANFNLLGQLIVLAVLGAVLENLKTAFASETTSKIGQGVIFLVLFGIAINSFTMAMGMG